MKIRKSRSKKGITFGNSTSKGRRKVSGELKWTICLPNIQKRRPRKVKNYREITLLNTGFKVLSVIILKRLERYTEEAVGKYQSRFRKWRSTTAHIFVVRQLMEKHYKYVKDLYMVLVDFKQASNSLDRERLWEVLRGFDIPMKMIKIVKRIIE